MNTTTVKFLVQLDVDKIQGHLSLDLWSRALELGGTDEGSDDSGPRAIEPTWDDVYERLAHMYLGAMIFKGYCRTAIDDYELTNQFVLNEDVSHTDDKPSPTAKKATARVLPMPSKKNVNGS